MNPMNPSPPAVEIKNLHYSYDGAEAIQGVNLTVAAGSCHALFGRNGAGKTTTMKCLLNLLRPQAGSVRIFGLDPATQEIEVKRRIAYVPDSPEFYPWMTVRETLDYLASFREGWNEGKEKDLLDRFRLKASQKVPGLSKGQRTQLALIGALCAEPELLILDEPTSGLDPIVRREFIETVIGAYQDGDPGNRTILVSTHLISEFEGLIDEFTLIDTSKDVLHMRADDARDYYRRIRARFDQPADQIRLPAGVRIRIQGRDLELIVNGNREDAMELIRSQHPVSLECEGLSLEEIFMHVAEPERDSKS